MGIIVKQRPAEGYARLVLNGLPLARIGQVSFKAAAKAANEGQAIPICLDEQDRIVGPVVKVAANFQMQVRGRTTRAEGVA